MSKLAIVELMTAPSKLLYKSLILLSYKSISMTFLDSITLPTATPWSKRFNVSFDDYYFFGHSLIYFWLFTIEFVLRIIGFVETSLTFFRKSTFVLETYDPLERGFGGKYFVLLYFESCTVDSIEDRFYVLDDLFFKSFIGGVYSLNTLYSCLAYSMSY